MPIELRKHNQEAFEETRKKLERLDSNEYVTETPDIPIENLDFSVRTFNALTRSRN